MKFKVRSVILLILAFPSLTVNGQFRVKFENQLSLWSVANLNHPLEFHVGGVYFPELRLSDSLKNGRKLETEVSFMLSANKTLRPGEVIRADVIHRPYRAWVGYSSPRLELRAGLQTITIGQASVMRPLMWFDKTDFRDPLQVSYGIYSLVGKYKFRNHSSIWLWTLYGNRCATGWAILPSARNMPEVGGRFQFPVLNGEAGITVNRRMADFSSFADYIPDPGPFEAPEEKIGLDGHWNPGIGITVQGVLAHNNLYTDMVRKWEAYVDLGLDYAFGSGKGPTLAAEHFLYGTADNWKAVVSRNNYSILSLDYQLNEKNSLKASIYYQWERREVYRFVSFQRKFEYWSFYVIGFWNPISPEIYRSFPGMYTFPGKGVQLMAVVRN
jgi:hypothetical protein